jgi:xanthine dehydrogenase iron-sulfur cluster and FAD-binding subunit A
MAPEMLGLRRREDADAVAVAVAVALYGDAKSIQLVVRYGGELGWRKCEARVELAMVDDVVEVQVC